MPNLTINSVYSNINTQNSFSIPAVDNNTTNSTVSSNGISVKTGEYPCSYNGCSKRFSSQSNLNRHCNSLHAKKRIHVCDICRKSFTRSDALKDHKNIHRNIKSYKCTICGREFKQNCVFSRHKKQHTANEKGKHSNNIPSSATSTHSHQADNLLKRSEPCNTSGENILLAPPLAKVAKLVPKEEYDVANILIEFSNNPAEF